MSTNTPTPAVRGAEHFVQALVNDGVQRMAGTDQHGVDVLIHLQVLLVEGDLAVRGLRFPQSPQSGKPVGTQVGKHVFDTLETIRARVRPSGRSRGRPSGSVARRSAASADALPLRRSLVWKPEKSTFARASAIPVACSYCSSRAGQCAQSDRGIRPDAADRWPPHAASRAD